MSNSFYHDEQKDPGVVTNLGKIVSIKRLALAAALFVGLCPIPANANYLWGHVTDIAIEYLPWGVAWIMDGGDSSCPAGSWLWVGWDGNTERVQDLYGALLGARLTGFYFAAGGDNNNCLPTWYHLGS